MSMTPAFFFVKYDGAWLAFKPECLFCLLRSALERIEKAAA